MSLAELEKGHLSLKDFEWEEDMRPSSGASQASANTWIPGIDLQDPNHSHLVSAISQAASSLGFFQVFNHPISLSALDALHSYARTFFSLPFHRKDEAANFVADHSAAGGPSAGYTSGSPVPDTPNKWWAERLRLATSDKQGIMSLAKFLGSDEHQQQAFREVLEECSNGFASLAKDLTILLLEGLGLKGHEVVETYIGGETDGLKINHYPPCPQPNLTLGVPPHTDVSILTILWQDLVGGVQVHTNGEWITAKPRRDGLVVNIGDIFQVWSNDRYLSSLHRVALNARESRYSVAYFYHSKVDTVLTPIQELLQNSKESSKFRSILVSEHRNYIYSIISKKGSEGVGYLKC